MDSSWSVKSSRKLLDLHTAEPDPALFQVPSGYEIVDETDSFTRYLAQTGQLLLRAVEVGDKRQLDSVVPIGGHLAEVPPPSDSSSRRILGLRHRGPILRVGDDPPIIPNPKKGNTWPPSQCSWQLGARRGR